MLIKDPETDKPKLLDDFLNRPPPANPTAGVDTPEQMPRPKHIDEAEGTEGWIEFKKPILYT